MQGKEAGVGLCEVPLSPVTLGFTPAADTKTDKCLSLGEPLDSEF